MVMLFNDLLKARKGQSRILEAAIAAVIIFIVFSVSVFLVRTSDVRVLQERADLDRLGYNVLHRVVESGTIEKIWENPLSIGFRKALLQTAVQNSLPSTTYFNLTVFRCVEEADGRVGLQYETSVNNTSVDSFTNSLEVSSTNMIYTSKSGNIYHLVLALARAGGG